MFGSLILNQSVPHDEENIQILESKFSWLILMSGGMYILLQNSEKIARGEGTDTVPNTRFSFRINICNRIKNCATLGSNKII